MFLSVKRITLLKLCTKRCESDCIRCLFLMITKWYTVSVTINLNNSFPFIFFMFPHLSRYKFIMSHLLHYLLLYLHLKLTMNSPWGKPGPGGTLWRHPKNIGLDFLKSMVNMFVFVEWDLENSSPTILRRQFNATVNSYPAIYRYHNLSNKLPIS